MDTPKPKLELFSKIKPIQWFLFFLNLFLVGFVIISHFRLHQYAFDDAYIHFRIARNFFEIGGPYYNANEALKVSTSSGWIVFLIIILKIAQTIRVENSLLMIVSLVNALVLVCNLVIYSKIVEILLKRQLTSFQRLLFKTILFAILLPSSVGLMETPLALLMAGLGIYFLLHSKHFGFALLGIATYLRLELAILAVLIGVGAFFRYRFRVYQIAGPLLLGIAPFASFDLHFYHSVVPQSVIAKSIIYSISPIETFLRIVFFSIPGVRTNMIFNTINAILFTLMMALLCWITLREWKLFRNNFWPVLLGCAGFLMMGFYIASRARIFMWYIPLFMLPILVAYFTYAYLLRYPKNIFIKIPLFIILILSAISVLTTIFANYLDFNIDKVFESGARAKLYLVVGTIIYEDYPHATLMASEIGGLGYVFKGKIFDSAGLASREALSFYPIQEAKNPVDTMPPQYVKLMEPDIIVSYDVFAQALFTDEIAEQYNIISLPSYLSEDEVSSGSRVISEIGYLRIYIRKSLPVSQKICALTMSMQASENEVCTQQTEG